MNMFTNLRTIVSKTFALATIFAMLMSAFPASIFVVEAASPSIIFADSFVSEDFSAWTYVDQDTENEWNVIGGTSIEGTHKARVKGLADDALLRKDISTAGYENISVSFYHRDAGFETDDSVVVEYSYDGGATWTEIVTFDEDNEVDDNSQNAWVWFTDDFPSNASDNADFQLRFRATLDTPNDSFDLDAVLIQGFSMQESEPEPEPVADGPDSSVYDNLTNTDQMCIVEEPDATYQAQVIAAADRLMAIQDAEGSWDWVVTGNTGPTGTNYYNITGVSAQALLDAYIITQDTDYLDAAEATGDYLIYNFDDTKRQNAFNAVFLYDLAALTGDGAYAAQADAVLENTFSEENWWSNNAGSYCDADGCTPQELSDGMNNFRAAYPGLAEWDLHTVVLALVDTDNIALAGEMQDVIQASVDAYSGTEDYYELGVAGALRAAAAVGDGAAIASNIALLASAQAGNGSFAGGSIQATAYALMALEEAGGGADMAAAAAFLSNNFGYNDGDDFDGWLDEGDEYAEINSEAAHALAMYIYDPQASCEPELSLVITNPAEDYDEVSGEYTFEAEYTDDDETVDTINWAIKPESCEANTPGVNLAGYGMPGYLPASYDPETGHIETTVDMSEWESGTYCIVINPQETGGETDTDREVRHFTLNNEPQYCSVTVVSDETNYVEETEGEASLLSFVHSAWTAVIEGAQWIWGDNPVVDPGNEEIQTFTKEFEWSSAIASATLDIASDNYYTVYLNGVEVAAEQSVEDNFRITTQDQYDVSGSIVEGVNELEIVVTNKAGSNNPQSNPAGLLYNLTIVSTDEGDECMYAPEEEVEPSLVITNPATDYEVLSGTRTFMAEYVDADDDSDNVQWAIRAGTCSANTNTVAGNVDGFSTPFDWDGADFSSTIDMSSWDDGDYCLVVNPTEDQSPYFRETRWFTLENPEVVSCEAGVNLFADRNGSFEQPVLEGAWSLVDPINWIVEEYLSGDDALMELQRSVSPNWTASDGEQYAELGGAQPDRYSQAVPTVAGKTYTLNWDFSPRPGTNRSENQLGVSVDDEELEQSPYMADGTGLNGTEWTSYSYEFSGTGEDVEIAFWDDGSENSVGTFLDNVSLTCNPSTGQADAYCGDGELNQDWEQCEVGDEGCADYCLYENACYADIELMKITLNSTNSASFDDQAYIGASDKIAPNGYWFNMADFGPDRAVSFVDEVDGLALSYDSDELKLAFEGNNKSGQIDFVQGSLEFIGFEDLDLGPYSDNISREINGSTYKLEPLSGNGGFPDVFEATDVMSIDFDMRADVGNDGATVFLTPAEEFGYCEEENGGEEDVEPETATYYGTVWYDGDADGVIELGLNEGYLPNINIFAGNGTATTSVVTDDNGYYSFDLEPGDWTIYSDTDYLYSLPTTASNTYELNSGSALGSYDFGLYSETESNGGSSGSGSFSSTPGGNGPEGQVLGASTSADMCVEYLQENIMPGHDNNFWEVLKLQSFLRILEGHLGVPLNGIYDAATQAAVGEFQTKYADNILTPWGIKWSTLNVYLTTRKTVNEIYCEWTREFPLTAAEQAEIELYRNGVGFVMQEETVNFSGAGGSAVSMDNNESRPADENAEETTENVSNQNSQADEEPAADEGSGGFWSFLKRIF